ncbi:hypothetical protein ABPG72_004262 [Tetrahymena utriculariae]
MGFIDLLKPAFSLIPEVQPARQYIPKDHKIVWTGITLFIYLVCCQIPLYGVVRAQGSDPFYWMRVILASNRGTLMELGISPLVTSSMIIQLLVNTRILDFNARVQEDRQAIQGAQKLLGLIMSMCEAFAYIWSGQYGDPNKIGFGSCLLIFIQLVFSGIVVLLLDDMLNKGYGIGSGISLFIATNICENIVWRSFSPITITTQQGTEFEGSIINLFHSLLTKDRISNALYHSFYRTSAPNLVNLISTLLVFLVVIYLQGIKYDLRIARRQERNSESSYPIKLFYTSNYPIILQTALVSQIFFFSRILSSKFKNNFFVKLLGQWQDGSTAGGQDHPIGGFVYFLTAPRDMNQVISDPIHAIFYVLIILFLCGVISRYWIEFSDESTSSVHKKFMEEKIEIPGHRQDSVYKTLDRIIPTAATLGGICVGVLTIVADFLGAIGSGTGILLAVNIIYGYFEQVKKENKLKKTGIVQQQQQQM